MQSIKFSFIIPHKNCPNLLQRCINSIPPRDDVQIVVVDDNSDCDKKPLVSREDIEVVLLDADHSKGAGRARNVGLEHAVGEWLLFADADDYYTDQLPVYLDKYKNDNDTDVVYYNAAMIDENSVITPHSIERLINNYRKGLKTADQELKYECWTPWTRMVKKHIVDEHQIRFDEIPAANDKMFGLKCGRFAQKIEAYPDIVYHYYRPSFNSITDKLRDNRMFGEIMDLRGRTILLMKEVHYPYIPSFVELAFSSSYAKGIGFGKLLFEYFSYLRKYKVCVIKDVNYYLIRREYYKKCQ